MSQPASTRAYAWTVVALLWVAALLNYLDRIAITTMREPIKASIAMTDAQFGLLTSVFLWVYAAFSPLGGWVADRFSRRGAIVASLFIWSAVTWLTGHARTFEQMFAARALMGLSEACYIPAALALIADYHRGGTRSLATGLHMSGIYAGMALAGLGGVIAEQFSWQYGFTIFGAVGVCYATVLFFSLKEESVAAVSDRRTSDEDKQMAVGDRRYSLLGQGSVWLMLAFSSLASVAYWSVYGWMPTYLREHFQLGLGAAGMSATGYLNVASFAGVVFGGMWADRWFRTNARGRALVPAIGFCLAAPCLFMTATTNALALALAGIVAFGLARGFADANAMPILCQLVAPRQRATAYGLLNCFGGATGGLLTYAGGAFKDAHGNLGPVFQFCAVSMFLAGLVLFAVRPQRKD